LTSIGEQAARLKWVQGLSWSEVYERFPDESQAKIRSAARRWRKSSLTNNEERVILEHVGANQLEGVADSRRMKTLDDLICECQVDLDIWDVERFKLNKWESAMKLSDDSVHVEPLYQVSATFIKKRPDELFPVIKPVRFDFEELEWPEKSIVPKQFVRTLVIADPHFGFVKDGNKLVAFHDRRVLDVILSVARIAKPDRIDIIGDLMDLAEWSNRYITGPMFYQMTQPALIEAAWWLSILKMETGADLYVYEGNHEKRMQDAIIKHLPAAYGLKGVFRQHPALSIPNLLGLDELGAKWISGYPADEGWPCDWLMFSHGNVARKGTGKTIKAVLENMEVSRVIGHIHRMELGARTLHYRDEQRPIYGFCPGCACKIDGTVPAKNPRNDWQNGCGIIDVTEHLLQVKPVFIDGGQALFGGRVIQATDRLNDLRAFAPEWNW